MLAELVIAFALTSQVGEDLAIIGGSQDESFGIIDKPVAQQFTPKMVKEPEQVKEEPKPLPKVQPKPKAQPPIEKKEEPKKEVKKEETTITIKSLPPLPVPDKKPKIHIRNIEADDPTVVDRGPWVLEFYDATYNQPDPRLVDLLVEVEEAGWRVRRVPVKRDPKFREDFGEQALDSKLANYYKVNWLPTVIVVVHGQEASRENGTPNQGRMNRMLLDANEYYNKYLKAQDLQGSSAQQQPSQSCPGGSCPIPR